MDPVDGSSRGGVRRRGGGGATSNTDDDLTTTATTATAADPVVERGGGSVGRERGGGNDHEIEDDETQRGLIAFGDETWNSLTKDEQIERLLAENQRLRKRNREVTEERERAEARARRADEERTKVEEDKLKAKEEKRKADDEQIELRRLRKAVALASGQYYSSIEEVWGTATSEYNNPSYFEDLRRNKAPIFSSPDGVRYYEITWTKANESAAKIFVPPASSADDDGSSARKTFPETDMIWPVNIFGTTREIHMHRAYLVPHSADASTLYFDVAVWTLGLQEDEDDDDEEEEEVVTGDTVMKRKVPYDWDAVQRMIHGTADKNSCRIQHTGIKHSVPNMICLANPSEFLDVAPCLLIIPILTLEEVKAWNGEGYKALVMAGTHRGGEHELDASFPHVCKSIGMTDEGNEASQQHIEIGRELLSCVLRGMAYSLVHRSPERDQHLTDQQKGTMDGFRKRFPANGTGLVVPAANPDVSSLKVKFVEFGGAADPFHEPTAKKLHPAPDPLLLAVRAAINWSRRMGQQLLTTDEPPPDVVEQDEMYQLAMEEYLDKVDRALRPRDDDLAEFARRLGQSVTST